MRLTAPPGTGPDSEARGPPRNTSTRRWFASAPTLGPALVGEDNNFGITRLVAASIVMLSHSYVLAGYLDQEPRWLSAFLHNPYLGNYAVEAFFVISGLLVAQSFERRRSLRRFIRARVLRLYPALICGVLLSIAAAAIFNARPASAVLADPATLTYFWKNATALEFVPAIAGSFPHNAAPGGPNGSLWTLPVELRMYVFCAVIGVIGLLHRPAAGIATLLLAFIALIALRIVDAAGYETHVLLAADFIAGMIAYLLRDRLRLSWLVAIALAALFATASMFVDPGPASVLFACFIPYWVLVVACHPAIPRVRLPGDYSYGIYLYAFPVQQAVAAMLPGSSIGLQIAVTLPATVALAALSWHLIEAPSLRAKR